MTKPPLLDIYDAAIAAADPFHAMKRSLRVGKNRLHTGGIEYSLDGFGSIVVVGAGKAAARMAQAVEEILGERITRGVIVVKYGHAVPGLRIEQVEASHPVPDEAGVRGTRKALDLLRTAKEETLVLCLLSGGGSALFVAPAESVTLEDKRETTDLLLRAGADIGELNTVRKHLSAVKGGRLSETAAPATVLSLILSDVIGDRLDVIASGPTASDGTTYGDALGVIAKYGLERKVPARVIARLKRGTQGLIAESVKAGDPCLGKTRNVVIGGNSQALAAARDRARRLGWTPEIIGGPLTGEAREAAARLARSAMDVRDRMHPGERRCLLAGGETTVTVRGTGKGGRNQELALAFALEVSGREGISLLSAGTDGTDGPTDAAGAIVDGTTVPAAEAEGLHAVSYLENNDSYSFFREFDGRTGGRAHLMTGPTGTNVMDLQVILVSA